MTRLPCPRLPRLGPRAPHRTARRLGALLLVLAVLVVSVGPAAPHAAASLLGPAGPSAVASVGGPPAPLPPMPVVGPAAPAPLPVGRPAARVAPAAGVWPLAPRPDVVAGFDPPATRWGSGHRGVDLAGHAGQPVRAALAGRVTFAGRLAGRGVVVVNHGSTRTTYEPVAATVRVGERVGAGAVLGRLQLFGSHCFPRWCLHWGLIEGRDRYLDPLTLVGAAPVRLLPLWSGLPSLGLFGPATQARGWAWR